MPPEERGSGVECGTSKGRELGSAEAAQGVPACVTQAHSYSHSWGPQHCQFHGSPRGSDHHGVLHHHLPAAAHPSQVPLHLQPAGPLQGLPGHAHGQPSQGRGEDLADPFPVSTLPSLSSPTPQFQAFLSKLSPALIRPGLEGGYGHRSQAPGAPPLYS